MIWLHSLFAAFATFRIVDLLVSNAQSPAMRCPKCMSVWAGAAATIFLVTFPWLNWPLAFSWFYMAYTDSQTLQGGDPVKIDFDEVLKDMEGEDFTEPKNPKTVTKERPEGDGITMSVTLKTVCVRVLTNPVQTDQTLTGEDAFKRLELARRINKGGVLEIDPAEAIIIRDRAPKLYGIQIAGLIYEKLKG